MLRRAMTILALVSLVSASTAGEEATEIAKPTPNTKDEALAPRFSAKRAAAFLDSASVHWTRERKCGSCHTNIPYLMARAALHEKGEASPGYREVRGFFENRVARWDSGKKEDRPRWDTEVVATAVALAFDDAQHGPKLHPLTRQALDRMWTVQRKDGAWDWLKCNWPPMEHDDYFGAVFAALGVGIAPEDYARTPNAQAGLARLRDYLKRTPAPDLHHKAFLLWASLKIDGLMSPEEQQATLKELRSRQRADGGWNLPSLGDWKRRDDSANDKNAPSDGYATGLGVYVLRQAGVPASDPAVSRGVAWLKANQRASGRWFTFSLNNDKAHYITHAGSGFAILALKSCDALKSDAGE